MNVLLTGGAGYIGSHVIRALSEEGHTCVAFDNLSNGHRQSVGDSKLIVADVSDAKALSKAMRKHEIDLVIHLAAYVDVGESVRDPGKYFHNNMIIGLTLLNAMHEAGVGKMVFSSSAAVYGEPEQIPIVEEERLEPINPYGASKLCVEHMLRGYARAHGLGFVSLRYFNVAGAHPAGDIGEDHDPEIHLIPLILQVPLGKRECVQIFGDDYDTPDGTCIRDYIHVCDLADAHVLAAEAIEPGKVKVYNLGNGEGFSVKQVIKSCREVTAHEIPATVGPRREGDPPRLVGSSQRAMRELGWKPRYPYLKEIVSHAWGWCKGHPNGYGG